MRRSILAQKCTPECQEWMNPDLLLPWKLRYNYYPFPWICVVFFTAVKNCFTSDENTLSKKKDISCPTTSQANCSVNRMICSRFLSDYLEIFSATPRKSLDNHSKTSHRSSCFPHSFFEVVEHENNYFSRAIDMVGVKGGCDQVLMQWHIIY